MKRPAPWIFAFLLFVVVLLTRTWGIQVDENAYFDIAIREPLGDARFTGKPILFYVVNYGVYHLLRTPAGWLHPLVLPVFYIACTVAALWRLSAAATAIDASQRTVFGLLVLAPLALFNATQLMMEAALLPLMTLTMAALLRMVDNTAPRPLAGVWLGIAAALSALMKETALPALLVLAAASFPLLGRRLWPLVAGAVAGMAGNRLLLWVIGAKASVYGGFGQMAAAFITPESWRLVPPYLGMWLFFVGAAWLGALWSWWHRRDRIATVLVSAGALSAGGAMLMRLATDPRLEIPRYAFPVLWVGLVAGVLGCGRVKTPWVRGSVVAIQLVLATGLWPGTFGTIRAWPTIVTTEGYANGGTILSGAPTYGWIAVSPRALEKLCVYLPARQATGRDQALLWFQNIAKQVGFYDEDHADEFDTCSGAKVIVDRRFGVDSCNTPCSRVAYRFRSCIAESILYYSPQYGDLRARVCLP
jgi:hypothetical protein